MADPEPSTSATPDLPGAGPTTVPPWLSHVAAVGWRLLVVFVLGAIVLALLRLLIVTTASVVLVGMIVATTLPLHQALLQRGWTRTRAATGTWLAAWGALALTFVLVALPLAAVALDVLRAIGDSLTALEGDLNQGGLSPGVSAALQQAGAAISDWAAAEVSSIVSSIGSVVSVVVLSFFLSFFVIVDIDRGINWALQFVPPANRPDVLAGANQAIEQVGGFVRDSGLTSVVRTAIVYLALLVLGVPYSAALAAIVFIGGFIPYLGGAATAVLVVLVTLTQVGVVAGLLLLALIVAIDLSLGRLMARAGVARPTRIHPAIVLAVLLIGAAVGGVLGLFAAVPVAAFVIVLAGPIRAALGGAGPRVSDSSIVPPWLDRAAQWSWRLLIAMALLVAIVVAAAQVPLLMGALLLAAILAATLAPLARDLRARGLSDTWAALGTTVGAAAVTAIVLGLTIATLVGQAAQIASNASGGAGSADQSSGGQLGWLADITETAGAGVVLFVSAAAVSLAGILIAVALACVLTFFLLRDGARGWHAAGSRLAGWRRQRLDEAGSRAVNTLGGYMIATGVLSAFGGITQFVVMFILGIPLALPLAVLSFFGGFIPYIGSFITTGLAFLVTLQLGSTSDVVVMAIFTVVFNLVQGSVLGPLVYGKAVSIHPAVVLIAIPVGSALAGIVGMFLVIPVLGIIATTWRTVLAAFGDAATASPTEAAPVAPMAGAEAAGTLLAEA
jgi:predicted PurR-regulated permease PerM